MERTQALIDLPEAGAVVVAAVEALIRFFVVTEVSRDVGVDEISQKDHELCRGHGL